MSTQSWVVVDRKTQMPIFETYSSYQMTRAQLAGHDVYTSMEWLKKLNQKEKQNDLQQTL